MTVDIVTLGEALGLVAPAGARLRHSRTAELSFGGAESNVAIGVARLGRRARWIGRVGADALGELVLDELRAERVDLTYARIDPERPTGLMLKHSLPGSVRVTYMRRDSAGSRLCAEDIPPEAITDARILHVTGITTALSSTAFEAVETAVTVAHRAGLQVSLDLNYRAQLWSRDEAAQVLRRLAREADIVFAGEEEVTLIVDANETVAAAEELSSTGCRHAVVKLGASGAVAMVEDEMHHTPPVAVDRVLDPVGAGDAFAAAYLVGVLEQLPPAVVLSRAATAGALAVTGRGDWEALPDRTSLDGGVRSLEAVER